MKVAIVHDWFVTFAGAERVVAQILVCYPQADVFSLIDFLPAADKQFLQGKVVKTSFIQRLPGAKKYYRNFLPLMPLAIEQFDFGSYDLVISSSHAVAKGIVTSPHQLHVSYVHTPMRYIWDLQATYIPATRRGPIAFCQRLLLSRLRLWDVISARRPDKLVANSHYIARRIERFWHRQSHVVYPPVNTTHFYPLNNRQSYYVSACRLVSYKRVDLLIEAFRSMPSKQLVLVGDGPEAKALCSALPSNITWVGWQDADALLGYLQAAQAFIFAGEEDFGILPVEAQACGTPVIAYGRGGLAETVRTVPGANPTGVLFDEQSAEAVCRAVSVFESCIELFDAGTIRAHAEQFSEQHFRQQFTDFVTSAWTEFQLKRQC